MLKYFGCHNPCGGPLTPTLCVVNVDKVLCGSAHLIISPLKPKGFAGLKVVMMSTSIDTPSGVSDITSGPPVGGINLGTVTKALWKACWETELGPSYRPFTWPRMW